MRENAWKLHEDIRLIVMYCGGIGWNIIGKFMTGRSVSACGERLKRLNIPRNRQRGPKPVCDFGGKVDWDIWRLRQKGLNKREIADELELDFNMVKNRMYKVGLHLHPPAGKPPEGVTV